MDVRDRDFSPMSLHYRDLMTTATALTNEGSRYIIHRLHNDEKNNDSPGVLSREQACQCGAEQPQPSVCAACEEGLRTHERGMHMLSR